LRSLVCPPVYFSILKFATNLTAQVISGSIAGSAARFPWLEFNAGSLSGTFLNYPEREQIPENIREQLIVELYSK
jgi:small subunit ribosomal protein S4